jgi:hypothetical protein
MHNVDPELAAQLKDAGSRLVQAVVQLRDAKRGKKPPSPQESAQLAENVLSRVTKAVGHSAARTNILKNVATIIVEADSDFVRSLIQQPEVVSALPSNTSESMVIPPHGKRPV